MDQRLWFVAGLCLVGLGLILAFVPRLVATPSGEPAMAGTFAAVGVPLAIAGLVLAWATRQNVDAGDGEVSEEAS